MNSFHFSDVYCGLSDTFQIQVTSEMIDKFIELSGDTNQLHLDSGFANKYGFKDRVVHGMLTASFFSKLVGEHLPGKYALFQGIEVTFTAPVFPGDILTIAGEVVFINDAYKQIELKGNIVNQSGQRVSRAKLLVGFNE